MGHSTEQNLACEEFWGILGTGPEFGEFLGLSQKILSLNSLNSAQDVFIGSLASLNIEAHKSLARQLKGFF